MTRHSPRLSDARFSLVIPAKAGIQGVNGSRALRAISNRFCVACGDAYLWVADPRQVTFLCLSKEKSPKERTPRSARKPLAFLAPPGARPTRRALYDAPRAQTRSRLNTPGGAAVLGARYGDLKKPAMIYRVIAIVFLFVLTNFSFAEESGKESSENCAGINAFRCSKVDEAQKLKKYSQLVKREHDSNANTLELNIQNGKKLRFVNSDDLGYEFQEYFREHGYFLIKKQTIEEATYLLVNQQTGKEIDIDELPLFSPDARRIIMISVCEAFCTDRIQIWKFSQNDMKVEWTFDPERSLGPEESWADGSARWIDNSTIEVTKVMRINLENRFEMRKAFLIKLSPEGWRVVKTK